MKKLIDISVYIIFMCLTACSSDEPKYPTASIDENSISLSVSGEGGKVSVSFSTNTSWIMEGPQNVIISPRSGSKGNNSVEITFPMSEDTKYVTTHKFYINTSSGENITFFDIEQDPAPYLECEEEFMLEQNGQRNTMTIHANAQPMILTEASWLTVELEKASDESGMAYSFKAEATENFALEERKAKVILSIGNLKKEINITQKGGILFKHELLDASGNQVKDNAGSDYIYSIPPMGGSYTLKIKSNSKWTVEKSNKNWSESFNYSQISEGEQSVTFSVDVAQLAKESSWGTAVLIFRFPDGTQKEIKFVQDDWGITLYVSQGQSLSNEIKKVRDKLNEGFFIDEIYIDGGDIDYPAPYTVRLVSISNVDNIREGFCHNCNKLTSLTLENIKQIGMDAFREHNLSNISIPASVTYIGDRAFFKTKKWYPYVTCYNPNPPVLGSEVFVSGIGVGELRIPMGSKPKYKANSLWSKQFRDYEEF